MANLVHVNEGATLTWTDTGGDFVLDLGGLAAGAVRVGARGDLGVDPRAFIFRWQLKIDGFDTAPVVGEQVHAYLSWSDGTDEDGDVGTADAAGVVDALPNLKYLGSASVQTTTAADNLQISGTCEIRARFVSPVIHNNTADALLSTADAHTFKLTDASDEIQ